jgi:hypothetical protein
VQVKLEDEEVLNAQVRFVRSRSPYGIAAGIVGITGTHPEDPSRSFDVQLIGSGAAGSD